MFRALVALLISVCLVGCTSMKAVDVPTSSRPPDFSVGDTIQISTKSGASYKLKVTELAQSSVSGTDDSGKRMKVRFDQIATVQVEKLSTGKTAGAGLGFSLLIVGLLFVVGVVAYGQGLKPSGD